MRAPHTFLQPLWHFYQKTPERMTLRETMEEMRFYRDLLHLFQALAYTARPAFVAIKTRQVTNLSPISISRPLQDPLIALQEKINHVRRRLETFLNNSIPAEFASTLDCSIERIQVRPMHVALDVMDRLEATALLNHIFQKNEETALRLLECGANEKERSFSGKSILELSIEYGLQQVVTKLCKKLETLDTNTIGLRDTPLHLAARQPNLNILKTLLQHLWYHPTPRDASRIDTPNELGHTAMTEAIRYGHLAHIKCLLMEGSEINAVDLHGRSPIVYAVMQNPPIRQKACMALLIEHKAAVNISINSSATPLIVACFLGRLSVVKQLVQAGATIQLPEYKDEKQPIEIARGRKHMDVVEWLEEQLIKQSTKRQKYL